LKNGFLWKKEKPLPPPPPPDPPPKNMTNMTKPNQALVMSKNEDNTASQSTPNHLTEKKKAEHNMIMFLG